MNGFIGELVGKTSPPDYIETRVGAFGWIDFYTLNGRHFRTPMGPANDVAHRIGITMNRSLERTIGTVFNPARNTQIFGFPPHRFAESNTLYTPVNHEADGYF
jgi:hypothetical protein